MDLKKRLWQTIAKVRFRLTFEGLLRNMQRGLLYAVLSACVILFVSRLFVVPYYTNAALGAGTIAFIAMIAKAFVNRTTKIEALHKLDAYYPYNELVTVLTSENGENPLVQSLVKRAFDEKDQAFQRFKKRSKQLFLPKTMAFTACLSVFLIILLIFPAATQQEAKTIEDERAITKDMEERLDEFQKEELTELAKKELQELKNKLKDSDNAEQALRELVKKQQELKLEEKKLEQKQDLAGSNGESLTASETKRLAELKDMNKELAKSASSAQSSLSKLGKPLDVNLQNTIANALNHSQSNASAGQNQSSASQNSNQTGQAQAGQNNGASQGSNQSNSGSGSSSQGNQGNNGATGQGNSSGSGSGAGNGPGGSQSNGNGNGTGSGNGSGKGQGGGQGSGAGTGAGHRNLLAIPSRLGGTSSTTVDGGKLGEGKPIEEKGQVPTTKGEIRPYQEVVGSYKDSYMESTDRLQLPNDLQQMVQSYFTSIESTN
ncbi:hypothetical protein [Lysinibacillus sp. 3P01SB]|uniref:hypothetical protein n=1 Tax=Lysinibacillus sp. 3P01SB TaxID=3132284 RepID=UPI0039A56085